MDRPQRMAIVDPDARLRRILSTALADLHIHVEGYGSAEAVLQVAASRQLGCIVAEVELPGASGLDLIRELHRREIEIPIILLSSRSEVSGAVGAMRAGAVDYFQKPFVHHKVRDRVTRIMQLAPR